MNKNERTYRMCEDGKLGVSQNGEVAKMVRLKIMLSRLKMIIILLTNLMDQFLKICNFLSLCMMTM